VDSAAALSLLVFPQRWDGRRLSASLLALPRGDPLHAPLWHEGAAFAGLSLRLQLELQPGRQPLRSGLRGNQRAEFVSEAPARAHELFGALHALWLPTPPPAGPLALQQWRVRQRQRLVALGPPDDTLPLACDATEQAEPGGAAHELPLSWGEVLSHALRQPLLARELGLVRDFDTDFTGWNLPALLADGGWLRVSLAAGHAQPALALAARLPPLDATARPLFTPLLFAEGARAAAREPSLRAEAEHWSDGFARAVRAWPNDAADSDTAGVLIDWDREQVLAWTTRQWEAACAAPPPRTLVGVAGYRVDVREAGAAQPGWRSLCGVHGACALGRWRQPFVGESRLDVAPLIVGSGTSARLHLPRHFAHWRGGSLVVALGHRSWAAQAWPPESALPQWRANAQFEFRVRLVDLSGGGPALTDNAALVDSST
jgi:hypothetical protein